MWSLPARLFGGGAATVTALLEGVARTAGGAAATPGGDDPVGRWWAGMADLTTAYHRELARAMTDWTEERAAPASAGATAAPPRQQILLEGALGGAVATTFQVENSDPAAAEVSLVPGPCRSDGGAPFAAPASIEPVTATLDPGERIPVTVRIDLDHEVFAPGREYTLPVRVSGPRPVAVDIVIAVTEVAEGEIDGPPFRLACPGCARTFERSTRDLRLRVHRTEDGHGCPQGGLGHRLA